MRVNFTKMHGCGNDYIYINCFDKKIDNPEMLSILMSERHFSVGGDGIVLIERSNVADAKMRMFNIDGSEGKMCGNAIRCIGKYLYDNQMVLKDEVDIETLSGIKHLKLFVNNGKVDKVSVDMGYAKFDPNLIPITLDHKMIDEECVVKNHKYNLTAVSMGNPHAITLINDIEKFDVVKYGKIVESDKHFPNKTNVEFVQVLDKNTIKMRVYERGSGETLACGSGACASVVSCVINGLTERNVRVNLLGGYLNIEYNENNNHVYMTGPAVLVFNGEINLNQFI